MEKHLSQISMATTKGRYSVVVTDGAGYHQDTLTEKFANLSTLQLPAYSPELNPIEQVWSWLRQHNLANQCFENYDDIVNKVSSAWNHFIESPKRVIKLCQRKWAVLVT